MATQALDTRYLDTNKLMNLLAGLFSPGQYKVKVAIGTIQLDAPRPLTQAEIKSVQY